jgi:general secretion pathway protein C
MFMKRVSNSALLSVFTRLLILLLAAKVISFAFWWYLPHESVELILQENYQPQYRRVDFKNMIQDSYTRDKKGAGQSISSGTASISSMILKGLFGNKDKGFVIIAMRSAPKKTSIVSVGEVFKGYTLKEITLTGSIFEKNGKDYVLYLKKPDNKTGQYIQNVGRTERASDAPIDVTRSDISHYIKNPKEIWNEISIVEIKDGKKIKGFKVTKLKEMSKLASLGLKVGDLIIKANNVKFVSYADVLNIYKHIDKLDALQLVVIRNNQEVELVYEIN